MPLISIGFLIGVLICQSLSELPSLEWCYLLIVIIPAAVLLPTFRWLLCVALGLLYSVFIAHDKIADQISPELEGKDLLITGVVVSLPDITHERTRFLFDISDLSELPVNINNISLSANSIQSHPVRVQISWFKTAPQLHVGQRWQLLVRLKRPRGLSNPGGFDYEAWLFQHDIHATGYVRDSQATHSQNLLLGETQNVFMFLQRFRERLTTEIAHAMAGDPQGALVSALVVGDRQGVEHDQWRVLTNTGTNHLMAISGLHIGLVAGLVFFLANRGWRLIPSAALLVAAPRIAAVCALFAALLYAALAGFTLPTQRALIMITIVMLAIWRQRPVIPVSVLAWALLAVLVYDPTAVINGSFWLSYGAVAIIFYTMTGRLTQNSGWWKWGRVQWVIAIGLFPVLLFWFQQVPLLSPVANLFAVPLVSFVTVPLSLSGSVLLLISPSLSHVSWWMAGWSLDLLWPLLEFMASQDHLIWVASEPPLWTLFPALLGILFLLAPHGFPARWLGVIWLLPLAFSPKFEIPEGALRLTMLDVGQGLASVIETRHHVLVYDAGPRFSDQFDAGTAVVVPFLKSRGIQAIDRVILSHNDIDHTGGFPAIINQLPVANVMVTPGMNTDRSDQTYCTAGTEWNWDGVVFRVLHPAAGFYTEVDNNMSCVVQISTESDKLLLTADIERQVETQLVKFFAANDDNLRADVVVVPHHGSGSSSSARFVQAVSAKYALISAGYRNRYHLPKQQVLDRYQSQGSTVIDTRNAGAISLTMDSNGISKPTLYRQQNRHYWSNVAQ